MKTCIVEGCQNLVEGRTDMCGSHNFLARKEEKQAKKIHVVKQPNKVSEHRAEELKEYSKLRAGYLAKFPFCEEDGCTLKSSEIHHQRGREGKRLLDINYFIALCHDHHVYYTNHSKEAIEKGISVNRTAKL